MDLRPSIVKDLVRYKRTRERKYWDRALDELADQVGENIENDREIDGEVMSLFYQMMMVGPPKPRKK